MEPADLIQNSVGWAVVLVIVRWMISRMDRLIDGLTKSVDAFGDFKGEFENYRAEDQAVHGQIVDELRNLRADVRANGGSKRKTI